MAAIFSSFWPHKSSEIQQRPKTSGVNLNDRHPQWATKMPEALDIYYVNSERGAQAHLASAYAEERNLYQTMTKVYEFFGMNFALHGFDCKGALPFFFIGFQKSSQQWFISSDEENDCLWFFDLNNEISAEAVAHEYMHAIIGRLKKVGYCDASQELVEAICDVFAVACKHSLASNAQEQSDWSIGDRDLSIPIDTKTAAVKVEDISHIVSHTFYEAVTALKDVSYGVIAKIWWQAFLNTDIRKPHQAFGDEMIQVFADKMIQISMSYNGNVQDAIKKSWQGIETLVKYS